MLNFIGMVPFSPAIIPEVNQKKYFLVKKTVASLEKFTKEIVQSSPDTIIFISPRGPMCYDKFTINLGRKTTGNFRKFGLQDCESYSYLNNYPLSKTIFRKLRKENFPIEAVQEEKIDYGTLVPLSFFNKKFKKKPKIINITFCSLSWEDHFDLGSKLKKILAEIEENVALIVSGDLSQKLSNQNNAQHSPYGIKFDQTLIRLLKNSENQKILNLNPDFCQEAGELGLRSIIIALGILDKTRYQFRQMSYESPLGGGFLVGRWTVR